MQAALKEAERKISFQKAADVDTFDMSHTAVELRAPPSAHAPLEERMEFLQQQLNSIGTARAVLGGLLPLGRGRCQRLQGGAPWYLPLMENADAIPIPIHIHIPIPIHIHIHYVWHLSICYG
jgi:hypothetical protein